MAKNQDKLFDDTLENPIANCADKVVELQEELNTAKKKLDDETARLKSLMHKSERSQFTHHGKRFVLKTISESEKLIVKDEKKGKKKKNVFNIEQAGKDAAEEISKGNILPPTPKKTRKNLRDGSHKIG